MSTSNSIRHAVRYALLTGAAAAAAGPAFAADQTIQEVVVTGSRIAQPNLETTSPVTQVTAEDVLTQGVTKIEDLVNQLPQAFAAQNGTVSNGATGTATVNLRGLGSARTLVLIDGRRMPAGGVTSASYAADLNQIPTAMVERVEVLTGGASAVYGSDAVAGVVNFIMKKDFEGIQIEANYGLYQHNNDFGGPGAVKLRDVIAGRAATNPSQFALPDDNVTDGNSIQSTITIGVSTEDGRGNLTAYASYQDNKAVLQRDRDYSACALGANPTTSFTCGGSGTAFPGTFTDFNGNDNSTAGPDKKRGTADDVPDTNPLPSFNSTVSSATGNTFRPFDANTDQYNFGPTNFYLRPDTRYSLGAMGHYELAPVADVYTQLMFTDVRSDAQIAAGGAFFNTGTINCDNPFLSAQQLTTIGCGAAAQLASVTINPATTVGPDGLPGTADDVPGVPFLADPNVVPMYLGRRNIEGGGRQSQFHNQSFRGLIGSRGDFADGWNYDASVQFSRTTVDQSSINDFVVPNLQRALDAVRDPDTGEIVCRSVLDGTDPNCIPYNPFTLGGVTQAALNYLQVPAVQSGIIDQNIVTGVITGDLGTIGAKLPWADDAIKVAFGIENRRDKLENTTDYVLTNGLLGGSGGPTIGISGSTNVNDYFMEASVPLVSGKTGIEKLSFDTAYRKSDYSSGIKTDTYKFGLDYAPVEDVRFRASYQRAARAPNIVELFTAQGFNLFDLDDDPCGAKGTATDDACLNSGPGASVTDAQLRNSALTSPAGQYNFNQGGNTALDPEESDTYSYGIVFTPRFAPGLSVSLDYFDIKVDRLISTFGAANTLDACYDFGDEAACGRIHRNAAGQLWIGAGNVDDLNINIGSLETSGVDLNLNYTGLDIGSMGSLSFNLTGTFLNELITDPGASGFPPFDCVGLHAGSCVSSLTTAANPELRTRFRVGWETPWNVDVALTHRYISGVSQEGAAANRIDRHFSAESYFDLFGSWNITDQANVRLGINNLLDNDPQINASVGTTGNGNTYPQVYDALGRYIFAGVTVKL
ncbi:MAG TPA: TonB-dependent receptor [Steroidobacteraceae bacterium]|nr:TonB-dependent receptor [Steroidobacteraceae bacterium]